MGSSDSGGGVADSSVGSIVWVRRRNGSWWPGKILGLDELSASHLMSPRSGTPVKLLGREDASVDWYNLEKSKRVKAFRCGEFDDCIERAEAAQGLPSKKREKYARREDAILHALELEKELLEKKYRRLGANSMKDYSSDSERKDFATPSAIENGNGKHDGDEFRQLHRKVDLSSINESYSSPLYAHKVEDESHLNMEDDNSEVNPRTRGLQDFGLGTALYKRRDSSSIALNDSHNKVNENHIYALSGGGPCIGSANDTNSRNPIEKRKRLEDSSVEEPLAKRRHNRLPMFSVMESSGNLAGYSLPHENDVISTVGEQAGDDFQVKRNQLGYLPAETSQIDTQEIPQSKVDVPVSMLRQQDHHPDRASSSEVSTSGSSEETESDSSETHSLGRDTGAEMTMLSDAETPAEPQRRFMDRSQMQGDHESTTSEESDESSLDDIPRFHVHDPVSSGLGFSKWQLKGKRNVRNLARRPMEKTLNHSLSYYRDGDYINDVDFIEDNNGSHMQGLGYRDLQSKPTTRRHYSGGSTLIDWDELTWGRPFKGYWEERSGFLDSGFVGEYRHGMLIDVDIKVQARHRGEQVPWVSLMSRLNGKAIIGHPIQIEELEDGATDALISTSDAFGSSTHNSSGNRVQPSWRTARRSANIRVPRPHLSQSDGDEDTYDRHFDQFGKQRSNKRRFSKKSHKKSKNTSRKVNFSSSQKTKALSSLGVNQKKLSNKPRENNDNNTSYYMDGVIKPLGSGPPTVACIPVKLVFSRLLETVGRPPSGPSNHGVSLNSNKERNPS